MSSVQLIAPAENRITDKPPLIPRSSYSADCHVAQAHRRGDGKTFGNSRPETDQKSLTRARQHLLSTAGRIDAGTDEGLLKQPVRKDKFSIIEDESVFGDMGTAQNELRENRPLLKSVVTACQKYLF